MEKWNWWYWDIHLASTATKWQCVGIIFSVLGASFGKIELWNSVIKNVFDHSLGIKMVIRGFFFCKWSVVIYTVKITYQKIYYQFVGISAVFQRKKREKFFTPTLLVVLHFSLLQTFLIFPPYFSRLFLSFHSQTFFMC